MKACGWHSEYNDQCADCRQGNLPPVRSSELVGRCVEVGDDDEGQPRLIIHTTREQLKRIGRNLAYVDVVVTIAPPNADISDSRRKQP